MQIMMKAVVLSALPLAVVSFSTLITFDVDGTLVSSSPGWEKGAHGRSFVHAVEVATSTDAREKTVSDLLEKHEFHGSTDGLILLRLARKMLQDNDNNVDHNSLNVNEMMNTMYDFVSNCNNEEVSTGIAPLPGVLDTLQTLASRYTNTNKEEKVACGLVTGNVEGIARRKMQALDIHATNVFTPLSKPQGGRIWDICQSSKQTFGCLC